MKTLIILLLLVISNNVFSEVPPLSVSSNGRFFMEKESKKPFFILGDTAWNLCALTREEIDIYLQSRVDNGINTIMFAINFAPQAKAENAYGEAAFIGSDKTELNFKNFAHVDYIIDKCNKHGIYVMLYSMWGGKSSGTMNNYTTTQLYKMGVGIGNYFGGRNNVIFITGGETTPHFVNVERVDAIGRGLKDGCKGQNMVAAHPVSEHSTAEFFADSSWLDFYMIQAKSGTNGADYNYERLVTKDYANKVVKPTMIGEHRYETGTSENSIIQRSPLYISVFAGAGAYAYGHNALWQMTPHTGLPWMLRGWNPGVDNWSKVLYTEAIAQLKHIQKLLFTYPYFERIADQSILLSKQSDNINDRVQLTRDGTLGDSDATYILAYMATSQNVTINTSVMKARKLNLYFFNPRTGETQLIKKRVRNTGTVSIPSKNDEQDWVIVIDDTSKGYKLI